MMVYACVQEGSSRAAVNSLAKLAGLEIERRQVERWTERIGQLRVAQRDQLVEQWTELPVVEKLGGCPLPSAPAAVMVSLDGGRLQIHDRCTAPPAEELSEAPTAEPLLAEDRESRSSYWRESKIGCLATLQSQVHEVDPVPQIPRQFLDPPRIVKLSREVCRNVPQDDGKSEVPTASERVATDQAAQSPQVRVKTVVATKRPYAALGVMLAAAAWQRGFAAAARKAFLGDGAEVNWTIWRCHFWEYTPILDFIHAISRVFQAALAGRKFVEGWPVYCRWAQWLWGGQVSQIIGQLEQRCAELGPPARDDPATAPRKVVHEALTYLRNHQQFMNYAEYRRQGLPITTSLMESTVKQIGRRVKGTEKFWSERGAEAMLQLRADYLSETEPMTAFWENWQRSATGQRHYAASS
ncbi:MAG: hypothetical protein K6T59_15525 [Bryobacteraceae bacterium]|nr:hypothetical protein [Bryobacteraceae bacterium]